MGDNGLDGVTVRGNLTNVTIEGNWLGMTPAGDDIGNIGDGIDLRAYLNTVVWPYTGVFVDNNHVGYNHSNGIRIHDVANVTLTRNVVGTDDFGAIDAGNARALYIEGSTRSIGPISIGGPTGFAEANLFAHSGSSGVQLKEGSAGSGFATDIRWYYNSSYENAGIALDLLSATGGAGPTTGSCSVDPAIANGGLATPTLDFAHWNPGPATWGVGGSACPSSTASLYFALVDATLDVEPIEFIQDFTVPANGTWTGTISGTFTGSERWAIQIHDGMRSSEFFGLCPDADNDGYLADDCGGDDCDDLNGTVHPNAVELCDDLDTDCTGGVGVDEMDMDGDGWTVCAGDCQDAFDWINPGATQLCFQSGADTDCDGLMWDVDPDCATGDDDDAVLDDDDTVLDDDDTVVVDDDDTVVDDDDTVVDDDDTAVDDDDTAVDDDDTVVVDDDDTVVLDDDDSGSDDDDSDDDDDSAVDDDDSADDDDTVVADDDDSAGSDDDDTAAADDDDTAASDDDDSAPRGPMWTGGGCRACPDASAAGLLLLPSGLRRRRR